jgi:hypothetical protein
MLGVHAEMQRDDLRTFGLAHFGLNTAYTNRRPPPDFAKDWCTCHHTAFRHRHDARVSLLSLLFWHLARGRI